MTSHYEIENDIGKAPLGHVWAGRDRLSGVPVVVKKIPLSAIGGGRNGWARHVDEIMTLTRLDHPQIPTVLEIGEEGEHLVIVMQQHQGRRLSWLIKEGGLVSAGELGRWMLPVIEALAVAHDAGVLHRQIHEDLIIVDDAGVPEMTGFGLTVDRRVTLDPMPPDLLRTGTATELTDQYLLGAMIHRLAMSAEPIPGLDGIVSRSTEDEPSNRFPDLIEMMEALGRVFDVAAAGVPGGSDENRLPQLTQDPTEKTSQATVGDELPRVVQDLHAQRPAKNRRVFLPSLVAAAVILTVGLGWIMVGQSGDSSPAGTSVRAGVQSADGPMAFIGELLSEGRLDEAEEKLEQVLANNQLSDPAPALDALGTIRLQQGLSDEASVLFERALASRAEERLYYKLSLAQASAGKDEKAMRTLDEGLRLFPESQRLKEARFHLGGV
ncbi:MAG: hypothetical protein DRJ65_12075 [Acidobacteria bacterium]|nr:MAG: hypothetical protein DRJ65_12075 [Acidobacteriota bacterium]